MKKNIYVSILFLLSVLPAAAQIRFGVSGGITMNKVSLSGNVLKEAVVDNYTGWYVGPTVELGIPVIGIKFDASAQYATNGAKVSVAGHTQDIKSNYLSVPVNMKFNFGVGSIATLYLSAGPQFDWAIGKSDQNISGYTLETNSSQISANLGGGLRLFKHLQVGAYYNLPFTKSAENKVNGIELKNSIWKINMLVLF